MARGRMVSKALSTSQKFARLHDVAGKRAEFCQLLFPLLVAHADDYGRQSGDTFTVKHAVVPTSPRKEADVAFALKCLHDVGLVIWYEVDGRKYLEIVDFDKHQSGLHKRTKETLPGPSGNFREVPGDSRLREENRTKEKGTEGKAADAADAPTVLPPLAQAWNELTTEPLSKCIGVSPKRQSSIKARLSERSLDDWRGVIRRINASSFCRGQNDRQWRASFDWLIGSSEPALKVLEGKYDDRATTPRVPDGPSPEALRTRAVHGERLRQYLAEQSALEGKPS